MREIKIDYIGFRIIYDDFDVLNVLFNC